jgi:two-component system, NarL family, invasion response regulator UvrY
MSAAMAKLYLVDDHPIVREGLRALLESHGHQVVGEAVEPVAALRAIITLQPQLVLLDLQLEQHSGLELLAELQRLPAPPLTVVLTMSQGAQDLAEALRLGARGYLLKDAPPRDLLEAIAQVLDGQRHVSPAAAELPADKGAETREQALAALSPRERQIIKLVVQGRSSASIGEQLHLSRKTVETYRSRLMAKLDVPDITALVRLAVRASLVDEPGT